MFARGFNDLGTPDLVLTDQVCCDASNLLSMYLNKQGFDTHIRWRRTPKDILPRTSLAVASNHVLLHETDEGVDPTYLQFLALVGLTHRVYHIPTLHAEIAKLFPERKIAVFRLGESALFGDSVATLALETRVKSQEVLGRLQTDEYCIDTTVDGDLLADIDDQTPLLEAPEEIVRAFYRELWDPAACKTGL